MIKTSEQPKIQIAPDIAETMRGIYGIFICRTDGAEACAYVGKSEQLAARAEQHSACIAAEKSVASLNAAFQDSQVKSIEIRLLEAVPYQFDHYCKDAQRLASRENAWIDYYQGMNMCLEQVPEGKRPSVAAWEEMKKRSIQQDLER